MASSQWKEALSTPHGAALIFAVSTLILSTFRSSLNPDVDFQLLEPKRLVLIGIGAVLFWWVIRAGHGQRLEIRRIGTMLVQALAGMSLLFALAVALDHIVTLETENVLARNLRWILLWSGYFGTGFAAWMALQYHRALKDAQSVLEQRAAPTAQPYGRDDAAPIDGFWVKTGRQTVHMERRNIAWIEGEGNYARVHGQDGSQGLVRLSLATIERQLGDTGFVRVHRSAICRQSAISGFRRKPSGAMLAILACGAEVPLGRQYARVLTEQARGQGGVEPLVRDEAECCSETAPYTA